MDFLRELYESNKKYRSVDKDIIAAVYHADYLKVKDRLKALRNKDKKTAG